MGDFIDLTGDDDDGPLRAEEALPRAGAGRWACQICTLINEEDAIICQVRFFMMKLENLEI
jgi:hypothetical protein